MHRVVALVHPPQSLFELACAGEVFGLVPTGLEQRYDFGICALDPGPIETAHGYVLIATQTLAALAHADTIVLPGWRAHDQPTPSVILEAVRDAHARGTRVLSICTAAFLLADAGLLDGRRATTHWRHTGELARRYPRVEVGEDVLFVDHGDIATSAGAAAGVDLCLHVVRQDQGAAYADAIARGMVMPPRREGGQAQYAPPVSVREPATLAPVLDWALGRLAGPLTVPVLAERACLSERTFTRRFTEEVGMSPGQWILARRVDAARDLLERGDEPVETVAMRVGLSSAVNLRRHFRARVGTTPAAYRRTFRSRPAPSSNR